MLSDPATATEVHELAAKLRLSITRIARQLRQSVDSDLTPTQLSVTATISRHGPLTLGELAEREQVASPTITKVVAILHEKGLVARIQDPDDRRFVRVELTAAGDQLLAETRTRRTELLNHRLSQLEPAQFAALREAAPLLDLVAAGGDEA